MSRPRILGILLAVQVALAALTWWPEDRSAYAPRSLLGLAAEEVSELRIARKPAEGEEPDPVRLVRKGDGWVVASAGDYPAIPEKVEEVLTSLIQIEVGRPIATQETSHAALKVGEGEYGRKVELVAGDQTVELLLGSASSHASHVRLVGESDVYLADGLSEWTVRESDASYYDASFLESKPEDLSTLSVRNEHGTLLFTKNADGWQLEGAPEGVTVDLAEVERFIQAAARVRILEPLGSEAKPEYGFSEASPRVEWSRTNDKETRLEGYELGAVSGTEVYVKATDSPFVIKANARGFDRIREVSAEDFVADPDEGDVDGGTVGDD